MGTEARLTARVELSPAAAIDLRRATAWYDARQPGLGDVFLRSVDACFDRIRRFPRSFPLVYGEIRTAILRRFPYVVFFRLQETRVEVIAIWHARRDP